VVISDHSAAQTRAVLRGRVDNNGALGGSTCHFEVALKSDPANPFDEPNCEPSLVAGDVSAAVKAEVTGLSADTEYVYRVVAENESGSTTGVPDTEFRTLPTPIGYPLVVTEIGAGAGTVVSLPAGIACGETCMSEFEAGTEVELSASAEPGSEFREWRGDCSGAGPCRVTMEDARDISAFFAHERPLLTLEKSGSGSGSVRGKPFAVNCGAKCGKAEAKLYKGAVVTLVASPTTGSAFAGWSGCDSEPEGKCVVAMNNARSVTVSFSGVAKIILNPRILTLAKAGTGQGIVKSQPAGMACEANCARAEASFAGELPGKSATAVALYAVPSAGSQFMDWINCPVVEGNVCQATMATAKSITAEFDE